MTKKPETVNEVDLIKRKDGLYYKKYARAPFTGKREYFQGLYLVIENIKNGKLEGLTGGFHENGQLSSKENYKNGKLEGLTEGFNEDGLCTSKARYKNGFLKELWVRGRGKIKPGTKDFIEQGGFSVHLKKRTKDL